MKQLTVLRFRDTAIYGLGALAGSNSFFFAFTSAGIFFAVVSLFDYISSLARTK